jgi:diacylglycerol kinase (ATP)
MAALRNVVIIYNPNSTGNSPDMAKKLHQQIQEKLPKVTSELLETQYAGHAEKLAYAAAVSKPNIVIVSVSGDGGYNEVINGALRAVDENKATPICAVLPGGNANDHYSSVHRRPILKALKENKIEEIDVMLAKFQKTERYAHSYIGLGFTPLIAEELNSHSLNKLKETWLSFKTYWRLRPFEIKHNGKQFSYDSILMTTIGRMAKHLTLSRSITAQDGNFALLKWPHKHKLKLTLLIVKAALNKPLPKERVREFSFTTVKPQPMQLDGELVNLPAHTKVSVAIQPRKLRTLL